MKSLLLASALCIAAAPAWAGTIGHDFCTTMQQQHVACYKEVRSKGSDGRFLLHCPSAISKVADAYNAAAGAASGQMKIELQAADKIWSDIAADLAPKPTESESDYQVRGAKDRESIISECQRLRALD